MFSQYVMNILGKAVYNDYALCLAMLVFWKKKILSGKCLKKCCVDFCVFKQAYEKHKCTVIAFKPSFLTLQVLQIWIGSKKFPQKEMVSSVEMVV